MLGKIIRYMRLASGHSQLELSKKTGIAQPTLSGYETAFSIPNFREVEKIAGACDFEIVFVDKHSGEKVTGDNVDRRLGKLNQKGIAKN